MSIEKLTALEIAAKIKNKEVSATEVAKHMVSQAITLLLRHKQMLWQL